MQIYDSFHHLVCFKSRIMCSAFSVMFSDSKWTYSLKCFHMHAPLHCCCNSKIHPALGVMQELIINMKRGEKKQLSSDALTWDLPVSVLECQVSSINICLLNLVLVSGDSSSFFPHTFCSFLQYWALKGQTILSETSFGKSLGERQQLQPILGSFLHTYYLLLGRPISYTTWGTE